jgi:hypothetical protein
MLTTTNRCQECFTTRFTQSTRSEKRLHFFSYIDHRPQLEKRGNMPSWIPRWNETREPWHNHLWCDHSELSAGRLHDFQHLPNTYTPRIRFKGVNLDTVFSVKLMFVHPTDAASRRLFSTFITDYLSRIMEPDIMDAMSNSDYVRLARTLTGGFLKTDSRAMNHVYLDKILSPIGEQFITNFFAFLKFLDLPRIMYEKGETCALANNLQGQKSAYTDLD